MWAKGVHRGSICAARAPLSTFSTCLPVMAGSNKPPEMPPKGLGFEGWICKEQQRTII